VQGRIVERGPPQVLRDAAHPYTRALLNAVPVPGALRRAPLAGGAARTMV
jgi:ABC-type dipeptide/oligopeptide/nickel transport system ATPase component